MTTGTSVRRTASQLPVFRTQNGAARQPDLDRCHRTLPVGSVGKQMPMLVDEYARRADAPQSQVCPQNDT